MTKAFFKILKIAVVLYILICVALFFFQEKVIFLPEKIEKKYQFKFNQKFEEKQIKLHDGTLLHGILFKADSSKGLIFYLHGNAGSLRQWGHVARTYTDMNYDVFIIDYRGYGKSEGKIESQEQLFEDNQIVYNEIKKTYHEKDIIVLGYSIGTGLASKLASTNNPKLLILQAPYYSLTDLMKHTFSFVPTFLLKYKFALNVYLKSCKMPVVIFHGTQDKIIYYGSSLKLKQEFKTGDTLIPLSYQGHNHMTVNADYIIELKKILSK